MTSRPIHSQYSREFRAYIERPGATTFPLTFNLRGKVFLTLLALMCSAGCNNTPSAPTPPPVVADPPEVTCPAPVTVSALTSVGAAVTYALPESRKGQGTVSVACTPPSGTTFPVGVTQAECVATDSLSRTALVHLFGNRRRPAAPARHAHPGVRRQHDRGRDDTQQRSLRYRPPA